MQTENEEQDISLMDLLLVLAENIKLLLIGPLLVGLVALAIAFGLPQSFTSQAILVSTPTQAVSMMASPLVLDPVIKILDFGQGQSIEGARAQLASQIKATFGKDALLRLDVTASSPADAQKLANLIIDQYLKSTIPGAMDRIDMEKRLAYAKVSLESVRSLIERITTGGAGYLNKPITLAEAGTSVVALGELQARYLGDVLSIPRALQGLSRDVVIQPPTLPTIAVAPKKSLIAVLAALASGFVLLLWVFVRRAWQTSAQDPLGGEKQARLRAALGFKARQP
jgi:LPS O-antigen subunit length determinant protein (WzzB/FepE family)